MKPQLIAAPDGTFILHMDLATIKAIQAAIGRISGPGSVRKDTTRLWTVLEESPALRNRPACNRILSGVGIVAENWPDGRPGGEFDGED